MRRMSPEPMQQSYLERVTVPLEQLTLGAAFKALLEYHRDQKYPWALADDLMFSVDFEYGDPERAGGLMGFFGMTQEGAPTKIIVALERFLDSIPNEVEEIDDDEIQRYESLMLEFEFPASALDEEFDGFYEDSSDYPSIEEFVKTIFESQAFTHLALLPAGRVEFVADDDLI